MERETRPASHACDLVPVTQTATPGPRVTGRVTPCAVPAPRASGRATVVAAAGPRVAGTGALGALDTRKYNGNGKEDPSARARGESNGSHPRVSGPVPNSRCNPTLFLANGSKVTGFGTVPERYTSIAAAISGEDPWLL